MCNPTSYEFHKFPPVLLRRSEGYMHGHKASLNPRIGDLKDMYGTKVESKVEPELDMCFSPSSKFQIIPLNNRNDRSIIEPETTTPIKSRTEFLRKMKTEYKYVAIRYCDNGKFLSCRRAINSVPKIAFTEYRNTIDEFECFEFEYHKETKRFSFKSHNELYLDVNRTFGTVESRSKPKDGTVVEDCSWTIIPLIDRSFGNDRVEFVGVVDQQGYKMQLQAKGGKLQEGDISRLKDFLFDNLKAGESTHFEGSVGLCYYLVRAEFNWGFVVLTSSGFPRALVGSLVNKLEWVYDDHKHNPTKDDTAIQQYLKFLMWKYDEWNEISLSNATLKRLIDKMEKDIDDIVNNNKRDEGRLVVDWSEHHAFDADLILREPNGRRQQNGAGNAQAAGLGAVRIGFGVKSVIVDAATGDVHNLIRKGCQLTYCVGAFGYNTWRAGDAFDAFKRNDKIQMWKHYKTVSKARQAGLLHSSGLYSCFKL